MCSDGSGADELTHLPVDPPVSSSSFSTQPHNLCCVTERCCFLFLCVIYRWLLVRTRKEILFRYLHTSTHQQVLQRFMETTLEKSWKASKEVFRMHNHVCIMLPSAQSTEQRRRSSDAPVLRHNERAFLQHVTSTPQTSEQKTSTETDDSSYNQGTGSRLS